MTDSPLQLRLVVETEDFDAALAFYRDALGLEVRMDVASDGFRWVTVGAPGQDLGIVLFQPHGGRSQAEGDALLTLAFDLITRDETHPDPTVRIQLTRALARMAGIGGMAGGQMLDLEGEGRFGDVTKPDVARLQQMKTGALLRFACISGAMLGQADKAAQDALDIYGHALGEAFQIADDLLDVEGVAASVNREHQTCLVLISRLDSADRRGMHAMPTRPLRFSTKRQILAAARARSQSRARSA